MIYDIINSASTGTILVQLLKKSKKLSALKIGSIKHQI